MIEKFTFDNLILFHYNELSDEDRKKMKHQIIADESISELSNDIEQIKEWLSEFEQSPCKESMDIILKYDKKKNNNFLESI